MASITESIENAEGGVTDFYDDGTFYAYDASGYMYEYNNVSVYSGEVVNNVGGGGDGIIGSGGSQDNGDGTVTTYDAQGNIIGTVVKATGQPLATAKTQVIMPKTATAADYAARLVANPNIEFKISDVANSPAVKNAMDALLKQGGQWVAKQIGGNTVLYKNNQGGIGTMNIKSLLIPAAIVAALVFAGK